MSTFTLPKYYEGTPGKDIMYPGVGKNIPLFDFGNFIMPMKLEDITKEALLEGIVPGSAVTVMLVE